MSKENKEIIEECIPVCKKCGNVMIWESVDGTPGPADGVDGEWLCPHCQGEIDFLGEENE
jgi:hypothetical protein